MVHSCLHWCPQADTLSLQGGQSRAYVYARLDRVMLDTKQMLWTNRRIWCTARCSAVQYRGVEYSRGRRGGVESIFEDYRMTYIIFLLSSTFPAI